MLSRLEWRSFGFVQRVEALARRRRAVEEMPLPFKRSPMVVETATGTHLTPTQQANLRIFRQVAAELRAALAMKRGASDEFKIINGYIESEAETARIRKLSVPVRRSFLASDPVNFNRILDVVKTSRRDEIRNRAAILERDYQPIRDEVESVSILNDRRVAHGEMFEAWIDAMVFYEVSEKVRRYNASVNELGKAVEGIGLHLAERIAVLVLKLDDVVADYLGESKAGDEPPPVAG